MIHLYSAYPLPSYLYPAKHYTADITDFQYLARNLLLQVHACLSPSQHNATPAGVLFSPNDLSAAPSACFRRGHVGINFTDLPAGHLHVSSAEQANDIEIMQGHASLDHINNVVSAPLNISPIKIMQYIKGKTSRKLVMEFKHIQKSFWGRFVWARGYIVASSGNVTNKVIREYIRLQNPTEPEDGGGNFSVQEG